MLFLDLPSLAFEKPVDSPSCSQEQQRSQSPATMIIENLNDAFGTRILSYSLLEIFLAVYDINLTFERLDEDVCHLSNYKIDASPKAQTSARTFLKSFIAQPSAFTSKNKILGLWARPALTHYSDLDYFWIMFGFFDPL